MNRREMISLYLAGGGAVALLAAGCSQQDIATVEQGVAGVINEVQKGVAAACAAVGKLIPEANSVFAVLASIVGSSNVVVATAVMISQAIADITQVGCPAPTAGAPTGKTAKGIPVVFY